MERTVKQGHVLFKYRGTLPVLILAGGLLLHFLLVSSIGAFPAGGYTEAYNLSCLILALTGLGVRALTVGHTPKGTSGRNTDGQLAHQLNTTGLYSMVRNPLYLGNFLIWLGVALLTQSLVFVIVFVLLFWWFYSRIILAEEDFLRHKFGEVYHQWLARTPSFLPKPGHFVPSERPFNWKKVLRKEKNGVAAVFAVFALYRLVGHAALFGWDLRAFAMQNRYWLLAAIGAGLYYFMIKAITSFTPWLENKEPK